MIPSDHFVRFYNEVFKFLDKQGNGVLEDYYSVISRHQELHCLELFKTKGLQGMYDYWEHIRIEENCDMALDLRPDCLIITMNKCPSLSKAMDNDAGLCLKYCDHCPGWIVPLLEKAGYECKYDIIDRQVPRCRMQILPALSSTGAEPEKCS
ncbi:MAG: hypothetical protein PHO45_01920 [Victivallaceae bacterium]|nr:hypothetical protein [Victivallaceae bacterium]MDD5663436.1 hypothetical protein [Victivallaceae bacterium]